MSFEENIDNVCEDIFNCLVSNGYSVDKKGVYISYEDMSKLVVKAITNDNPLLHFSMKLAETYLVCDEDKTIRLDTTNFKSDIEFKPLSKEEQDEKWKVYNEYLYEIGDITEEELSEALKEV